MIANISTDELAHEGCSEDNEWEGVKNVTLDDSLKNKNWFFDAKLLAFERGNGVCVNIYN